MRRRPPHRRGWTRHPEVAALLQRGIIRFRTVYPWAVQDSTPMRDDDLHYVMLTAAEIRSLDPWVPAIQAETGHNDGPSWTECVALATGLPEMRFAGFLMPPARADEGIDLDAVYLPQPDPADAWYRRAITRPDGTRQAPDEDGFEHIEGRTYRRLWWD